MGSEPTLFFLPGGSDSDVWADVLMGVIASPPKGFDPIEPRLGKAASEVEGRRSRSELPESVDAGAVSDVIGVMPASATPKDGLRVVSADRDIFREFEA